MASPKKIQILKAIEKPRILLSRIIMWSFINKRLPDSLYLKIIYYLRTGKKLDLKNPKCFNEKIQWLKLHNKNSFYTKCVDKLEVRDIIKKKIGEEHLIPIIGYWNNPEDIDFDSLPNQFVLKCTHDSGSVIICRDKTESDYGMIRKKLSKALKKEYFWIGREYPYKNVKPRIICEKLMVDGNSPDITDYKFFCFNGEPKILFYASERFTSSDGLTRFDYYDMNLNHLGIIREGNRNSDKKLSIPLDVFNEMKNICKILADGFPFVRVDLYLINNLIYFGELTFFPAGGFVNIQPYKWNKLFGDWIELPKNKEYENLD